MTDPGRLSDTYAAALQHDLADIHGGERIIGVVRRPLPWFYGLVDENVSELGPPTDLLNEFKSRFDLLVEEGADGADAHNRAMDDVDFDRRYRTYLDDSEGAQRAIGRIEERLMAGDDVVLVCYENTDEKRCHRSILRQSIERRL